MKIRSLLLFWFSVLMGLACQGVVPAQAKPEPYTKKGPPPMLTAPRPDLVIRSVRIVEPGSNKFEMRVVNIGKADAGYFEVSYACNWYPKKPDFNAGAVFGVETLASGATKVLSGNCPNNGFGPKLKFGAHADWNNKLKESNEKNNVYSNPDLK